MNIRDACSAIKDFVSTAGYMIRDACIAIIRFVLTIIVRAGGKWEWAFVISCIAVAVDPLFLYIPIVDETNKCLAMDNKLRTTVLVFRSLTDFLLLSHIIAILFDEVDTNYEISPLLESKPGFEEEFDSGLEDEDAEYWFYVFSLTIKCLAILPIPQVAVLVGFFALKDTGFIALTTVLNFALVLQYLPRIGQIYLNLSKFSMLGKWAKSTFLLFLYILAGHVLGGLWYFFAIQRETSCWHEACRITPGCKTTTFKCNGSSTRNITILHQLCPSLNSTPFDFGMFAEILQSGNTGLVNFPTKFSYTLWWGRGLKNLSNFGTNIPTNSNPWENCFAILICVIGLLLFLYLMGNMQMHMQSTTDLRLRNEERIQKRIAENKKQIMLWIKNTSIPASEQQDFKMALVGDKVMEKKDMVDVDVCYFQKDPFPKLIYELILEYLGATQLKKVDLFKRIMDESQLRTLARSMKPGVYQPNSTIIEPPQLLDQMFFIVNGGIVITDLSETLNDTQYYGTGFPGWVICNYTTRSCYAPLSRETRLLKSSTAQKLEVLTLGAWDLLRFLEGNNTIDAAMFRALRYEFGNFIQRHQEYQPLPGADIRWKNPPSGWLKLNCTAVYDPNTWLASQSFVLRSDTGDFIAAGSNCDQRRTYFDRFHAGAQSIYDAMRYILQHSENIVIIVESDDKLLIDWFINERDVLSRGYQLSRSAQVIIQGCVAMIRQFKTIRFIHCYPESNAAALVAAQHALRAPGHYLWDTLEGIPGESELADALDKDSPHLQKSSQEQNEEVVDIASASTSDESHANATSTDAAAAAADDICDTTFAKSSMEA